VISSKKTFLFLFIFDNNRTQSINSDFGNLFGILGFNRDTCEIVPLTLSDINLRFFEERCAVIKATFLVGSYLLILVLADMIPH
jgi:hypothetical protein